MNLQLPADLTATVQSFLAGGRYADEEAVLREALAVLKHQDEDLAAINAGIEDMNSGRIRPWTEVRKEIQAKFDSQKNGAAGE